jgi:hypothetical protein
MLYMRIHTINAKTSHFYASSKNSKKPQESCTVLIIRQKSCQGLAMYGHEAVMPLQTRAKFLGTYSATLVTVSVTRDFNMT